MFAQQRLQVAREQPAVPDDLLAIDHAQVHRAWRGPQVATRFFIGRRSTKVGWWCHGLWELRQERSGAGSGAPGCMRKHLVRRFGVLLQRRGKRRPSPGVHSSSAPTGSCRAPASATLPLSCATGTQVRPRQL